MKDNGLHFTFTDAKVLQLGLGQHGEGFSKGDLGSVLGGDSVAISFDLLNPGEWFELQFMTDGPAKPPHVRARIVEAEPMIDLSAVRTKFERSTNKIILGSVGLGFVLLFGLSLLGVRGNGLSLALSSTIVTAVFYAISRNWRNSKAK